MAGEHVTPAGINNSTATDFTDGGTIAGFLPDAQEVSV